jgi:NAD(P)-dependent dehydrogenase (short-subunit alcohol dehydrogenase family)
MSKAAIAQLTRQVAAAYGKRGIRCNAIAPSTVLTRNVEGMMADDYRETYLANSLTPYLGWLEDVASLVVYLSTEGPVS